MTHPTELDSWLAGVEADPDIESRDAADLRRIGEALTGVDCANAELAAAVSAARSAGRSWTEIANVLGVSRQAARQRFADTSLVANS